MSGLGFSAKVRISPIGFIVIGLCGLAAIYYFTGHTSYVDSSQTVSMKQLLAAAIDLAQNGGDAVRFIKEDDKLQKKSKGKTKEGVDDPVTQGDMLSHRAIVHGFEKAFPSIRVVSEENDKANVDTSLVKLPKTSPVMLNKHLDNLEDDFVPFNKILIWVDPLDATKEYTEDLLQYVTTMVCIVVNGIPVAGVIHSPFLKKTSWAWVGHGSSPDLKKTDKSSELPLESPKIIVSLSHAGEVNRTLVKAFGKNVQIIRAGGAGYKVLALHDHKADAYVHLTFIKKWDLCAGDALLRAKNGKMTTLDGNAIDYGNPKDILIKKGLLASLSNHHEFQEKLQWVSNKKD